MHIRLTLQRRIIALQGVHSSLYNYGGDISHKRSTVELRSPLPKSTVYCDRVSCRTHVALACELLRIQGGLDVGESL